jgi:hypothetical protein
MVNAQSLCKMHSHFAKCTVNVQNAQSMCKMHSHGAKCTVTVQNAQWLRNNDL